VSGSAYQGTYRQTPRRSRHARVVADNDFDATPDRAAFGAYPTTSMPTTSTEAGAFGVDTTGQMYASNGTSFIPVHGNRNYFSGAAKVLTAADSGSVCSFSTAAGYTYTLPTPAVGLFFEFHVDITITSVAAKIVTATPASQFLRGWFVQSTDGTFVTATHSANGTTHVAWSGNGSTTSGILGDRIFCLCVSSTIWQVWGNGSATGAEATPFATS
jgi:hypothetical protein